MKGFLTPVGRQPRAVYWRRRVVLLFAVGMIAVVGWLILKAVSAAASEPSTDVPAAEPSAAGTVSPSPSPSDSAAAIGACTSDDIAITVVAKPAVVGADQQPTFIATLEQVGAQPCVLDAAGDDTTLRVGSGDDRIWFSAHCPAEQPLVGKEWLLEPGDSREVTLAWPRIRSTEGCGPAADVDAAGTYWAKVIIQGIEADRARFELA